MCMGGQAQAVSARLVCQKSAAGGGSQWREAFILTIDGWRLLPVQESSEITNVKVIVDNNVVKTLNVKLATDNIDYYVGAFA